MEVNVSVSESLYKEDKLFFAPNEFRIVRDCDDGGCRDVAYSFGDISWCKRYDEESFTIEMLLKALPKFIESLKDRMTEKEAIRANMYIEACKGWHQTELEVIPGISIEERV